MKFSLDFKETEEKIGKHSRKIWENLRAHRNHIKLMQQIWRRNIRKLEKKRSDFLQTMEKLAVLEKKIGKILRFFREFHCAETNGT